MSEASNGLPLYKILPFTLLSIDPSQGWAIWDGPKLWGAGEASSADARWDMLTNWEILDARRLVVAMEFWTGHAVKRGGKGGHLTPKTCFGMGAGRGRWFEALENAGYRSDHVIEVLSTRWQKQLGVSKKEDVIRWACRAFHLPKDLSEHAADAIAVGQYAIGTGQVSRMVKKIARAKKGVSTDGPTIWTPARNTQGSE